MGKKFLIIILILTFIGIGVFILLNKKIINIKEQKNMTSAKIETNLGDIKIELYEKDAPKTVKNFLDLIQKDFYKGLIFHRIVKNFVIQAGDPLCNPTPAADTGVCGTGGPGYQFEDELNSDTESYKNGYKKGVVAMANSGPNTNGSQFFIMLADTPLPANYTIFGKVLEGMGTVEKIGALGVNQEDRPLQPVIIQKIEVEK